MYLKGSITERKGKTEKGGKTQTEKERSFSCWVTPQMAATMVRTGPGRIKEPGAAFGSPHMD